MKTNPDPVIRFEAAKGKYFLVLTYTYILLGIAIIASGILLEQNITSFDSIVIFIWAATCAYHFYRLKNTYYQLYGNTLFYRSGFTKGSIPISSIRKVNKQSKMIGDFKASLSGNGLLLIYNKYDELFIAPKDPEALLAGLLKINPKIEVTAPKKVVKTA